MFGGQFELHLHKKRPEKSFPRRVWKYPILWHEFRSRDSSNIAKHARNARGDINHESTGYHLFKQ